MNLIETYMCGDCNYNWGTDTASFETPSCPSCGEHLGVVETTKATIKEESKLKKTAQLFCKNGEHGIDGLSVEEGSTYVLMKDNYGEFFEDDKGNEHYLADLNWESVFNMVNA